MDLTPLRKIAIGLALALTPAAVPAGLLIQSDAIGFNGGMHRPLTGELPLSPGEAHFLRFFPEWGTLNSATWTVRGLSMVFNFAHHVSAIVPGLPLPNNPVPYTQGVEGAGRVVLGLLLPGVNAASSEFIVFDTGLKTCQGFAIPLATVECVLNTAGNRVIDASFTVAGSDLDLFMGTVNVTAQSFPVAQWATVPAPGVTAPLPFPVSFLTGSFFGGGTLELTYNFTPGQTETPGEAPLPATPLLLAAGLLGLIAARRRR